MIDSIFISIISKLIKLAMKSQCFSQLFRYPVYKKNLEMSLSKEDLVKIINFNEYMYNI